MPRRRDTKRNVTRIAPLIDVDTARRLHAHAGYERLTVGEVVEPILRAWLLRFGKCRNAREFAARPSDAPEGEGQAA